MNEVPVKSTRPEIEPRVWPSTMNERLPMPSSESTPHSNDTVVSSVRVTSAVIAEPVFTGSGDEVL